MSQTIKHHRILEQYSWSAFDKNRCNADYHNGQQVRFLRQMPETVNGGFAPEGWFARFIERYWKAR